MMTLLFYSSVWPRAATLLAISSMICVSACQHAFDGSDTVLEMHSQPEEVETDQDSMQIKDPMTLTPSPTVLIPDEGEQGIILEDDMFSSSQTFRVPDAVLSEAIQADGKRGHHLDDDHVPASVLSSMDRATASPRYPPLQLARKLVVLPNKDINHDTAIKLSILNIIEQEAQEFLEKGDGRVISDAEIAEYLNQHGHKGLTIHMIRARRGSRGLGLPGGGSRATDRRPSKYQSGEAQEILHLVQAARAKLLQRSAISRKRSSPTSVQDRQSQKPRIQDQHSSSNEHYNPLDPPDVLTLTHVIARYAIHKKKLQKAIQRSREMKSKLRATQQSIQVVKEVFAQTSAENYYKQWLAVIEKNLEAGSDWQKEAMTSQIEGAQHMQQGNFEQAQSACTKGKRQCGWIALHFDGALTGAQMLGEALPDLKEKVGKINSSIENIKEIMSEMVRGLTEVEEKQAIHEKSSRRLVQRSKEIENKLSATQQSIQVIKEVLAQASTKNCYQHWLEVIEESLKAGGDWQKEAMTSQIEGARHMKQGNFEQAQSACTKWKRQYEWAACQFNAALTGTQTLDEQLTHLQERVHKINSSIEEVQKVTSDIVQGLAEVETWLKTSE